jgi:murein biosynthesis integral membrane protein MurJ
VSDTGESGLRRASALMASGTAVSRVLGLVRGMVLVAAVGATGQAADAFAVANKLPNVLYMLLAGGVLNAVLVPQVVRAYKRNAGQEYVDRLLTFGFAALGVATLLLTAASPLLVRLYADPCSPAQVDLATTFAFWCVPQMFFYGAYALIGQALNARGSFGPFMWAPVVNNVVSIIGFGVFIAVFGGADTSQAGTWTTGQVALLAGSATLGVVTQALVLVPAMRRAGISYRVRWGLRGSGLGRAGSVATWTLVGLAVGQVGYVVVSRVASQAPGAALGAAAAGPCTPDGPVAGNAAYDWAFLIFMLPHSLVTVSLATALFTRLAAQAHDGDVPAVRASLSYGLRVIGVFTSLATVVIMVLAYPVSRIVLLNEPTGAVRAVTAVVVAMIVGLPAFGAWSMCQRVFYAYEDARGMVPIQVAMAVVVIVGTLVGRFVLPPASWVVGIGLSMSASYVVGALAALWKLIRERLHTLDAARIVWLYMRAGASAVVVALLGLAVRLALDAVMSPTVGRAVLECVVIGTLMAAAYVVLLRLLRVDELDGVLGPLLARIPGAGGLASSRLAFGGNGQHPRSRGQEASLAETVGRGTVLAGRYRVLDALPYDLPGGSAWQATDQILDRPVRVRVVDSRSVAQALDAARRAALVVDPRLVRVLDVGSQGSSGYVVYEDVAGPSLVELAARAPLTPEQARAVIGEAATALEAARRRGVHHLALRPSALHVNTDGRVQVSGLALDAAQAGVGDGDARTTSRADAVGLVRLLYAALTGTWPADPRLPDLAGSSLPPAPVMDGVPVPPADLVPGVPNDLDTLCTVTLGPHEDGPHTPGEVVRELEPWGSIRPSFDGGAAAGPGGFAGAGAAGAAAVAAAEPPGAPRATAPVDPSAGSAGSAGFDEASGAGESAQHLDDDDLGDTAPLDPLDLEDLENEPYEAASGAVAPGPIQPPAPVRRQSVRESFGRPTAGANRPGTPPPAVPTGSGAFSPTSPAGGPPRQSLLGSAPAGPTSGAPTAATAPLPPGVAPTASGGPFAGGPPADDVFADVIGMPEEPPQRSRTAAVVLAGVAVVVVVVIVIAFRALFSSLDRGAPSASPEQPQTSSSASASPSPSATQPSTEPTTSGPPPAIASATVFDPSDGEGDHPEAVDRAFDGDPSTYWYTMTYKQANFSGFKEALGYVITLEQATTVTSVTLNVSGEGGKVEIRNSGPDDPGGGDVLASGSFSPTTTFTFDEPVETDHLTIWITELPTANDGSFRLELNEIELGGGA